MTAEPRWADQDSQTTAFEPVGERLGAQAGTYQGMRWFKCDLQVQTPEDAAHWQDGDLRLGSPRRPGGDVSAIQDKARRFLRRCHELELDVVGITDHNFSNLEDHRDWFLTHLVEKNKAVATELGRQPLWILPGFEVDIGYHVLCLFEPARSVRNLQEVNRTLTQLGLREGDRYQNGTLKRLRRGDEYVSLAELLSCVQDEQGGIVVAAHADQKDGLLFSPKNQDDFQLMGLLAVELTSLGTEKYRDIVRGKNREWGREDSPPAWLMSSDAKSLAVDEQGHPGPNSLGYRHTWIKMSRPSIEALRQAFLDPESRLRPSCMASPAPDPSPIRHAFIRSIRIQGVDFLEDQEIEFSPGLNCLIGGRGSGKSTVLEYLRVMMGKRRDVVEDDSTKERIDRVWNTVDSQKSQIEVRWQNQDGQEDRILQQGGEPTVAGRPIDDPETWFKLLPARFFSQQQISQMTKVDG